MSPNTLKSSAPEHPLQDQGEQDAPTDVVRQSEATERIARIDGQEVPLIDRVQNESQSRDPDTKDIAMRYSRHPHIRKWLDKLGPRHEASKK